LESKRQEVGCAGTKIYTTEKSIQEKEKKRSVGGCPCECNDYPMREVNPKKNEDA
jgi:hypothetical protein